jgi:type I restriction enzyme S subunit
MLSDIFLSQLTMTENRVKMPKINQEELSQIIILCPPDDEQQNIVHYLDSKMSKVEKFINLILKDISLINEYRTRLISDVVTGKLDVRGVTVPEYDIIEESANHDQSDDSCDLEMEGLQ